MFSLFREFDNDPFFAGHREHMHQMDRMFGGMMDPYGRDPFQFSLMNGGLHAPMPMVPQQAIQQAPQSTALQAAHSVGHNPMAESRRRRYDEMALSPFGMFDSMFVGMRGMFDRMHAQMESIANNPNANCYTSSSVMTYSNTGDGRPRIYQASSHTRQGPGGVKETRRSVRDSERGIEKLAVGHHLGERAHIVERAREINSGNLEETVHLENLEEEEADAFDREWRERAVRRRIDHEQHQPQLEDHPRRHHLALPSTQKEKKRRK